jgi:hypothetical protein
MTLDRVVSRAVRPVACVCLALLGVGSALAATGPTGNFERYGTLFWVSAALAAVVLAVTAALPGRPQRRLRTPAFSFGGLLLAVVAGNGLTDGPAQTLLWAGAVAAFCVAVPSLLLSMEAAQNRPVSRL